MHPDTISQSVNGGVENSACTCLLLVVGQTRCLQLDIIRMISRHGCVRPYYIITSCRKKNSVSPPSNCPSQIQILSIICYYPFCFVITQTMTAVIVYERSWLQKLWYIIVIIKQTKKLVFLASMISVIALRFMLVPDIFI